MQSLKNANKVVGVKQSRKAIKENRASCVYIAADAQEHVTTPILDLCRQMGAEVFRAESMEALGAACGIDVGAAVVVVLKD